MALIRLNWMFSYQTILFDTLDGDLDATQYAVARDKNGDQKGYYVRLNPNKESHDFDIVDINYDITGLTEVQIIGDQIVGETAYDAFDLGDGKYYRSRSDINKYKALALKGARPREKDMEESEIILIKDRI